MVKLSIVIPAYNEEKYIEDTLLSIKHADFTDVEIIVVCNGCTDQTAKIAKKYASKVLEYKKKGVSFARNIGAEKAKGDKIIFLDADIKVDSRVLEEIANSKYELGVTFAKPNLNGLIPKTMMQIKNIITPYTKTSTGLIFCNKKIFEEIKFKERMDKHEDRKFIDDARKIGKFGVVRAYVINNMRRFEKNGYLNIWLYWTKDFFIPNKKEYEAVR